MSPNPQPPTIDVVVIGLNTEKTLGACLESVAAARYPKECLTVFYVDGGSSDASVEIARRYDVHVSVIDDRSPTPGRQRNAGWKAGTADYVQFLDSDTVMDSDWPAAAVAAMGDGIGAVSGDLRELHPEKSVFNWIADKEWNAKPGEADAFGGIVMIRRAALQETGGYDRELIAGEDPELAYRVRGLGFRILKIERLMAYHDLAMYTLRHYWKRAARSGYAFAQINHRHPDFWKTELRRIVVKGGIFCALWLMLPSALLFPWLLVLPLFGTLVLLRPRLLLVDRFRADLSLTLPEARTYAWHASLVALPQFFGVLRYLFGRVFSRPARNKRR